MRRYRIGRSETNDIVIPDASVSRQHAEAVEIGGGRFSLSDLGSTFGTYVQDGQNWAPAKETEIGADTVIRFGEFRTTLFDVLSDSERRALGLKSTNDLPEAPAPQPPLAPRKSEAPLQDATSPTPVIPPSSAPALRTAAPPIAAPPPPRPAPAAPTPRAAEKPPAASREALRAPPAARPYRPAAGGRRRAMMLGIVAVGAFFALGAGLIAMVLAFGNPDGAGPRPEPRTEAGPGQQRFLEACKTEWGIEERRCRCFLAAAGPHLEAADYDDFAALVQGHLSGESDRMESVMQQATEKRGAPAGARLSAAMKGVTRDCQE